MSTRSLSAAPASASEWPEVPLRRKISNIAFWVACDCPSWVCVAVGAPLA